MEPDGYYSIHESSSSPRTCVTFVNMMVLKANIYKPPHQHKHIYTKCLHMMEKYKEKTGKVLCPFYVNDMALSGNNQTSSKIIISY
jgi:hypothetical protein